MEKIYKGGLILLIGFIIAKFGGVLFRFICVNQLPPLLYGELAIFLILYGWLILIATFSITIGLAKFVAQDRKNKNLYYKAALIGSTLISLVVSLILIGFVPPVSNWMNISSQILYWLAAALPFAVCYNLTIFYYRGLYKMKSSVLADFGLIFMRILFLIILFFMAYQYAPYIAFLISFIVLDLILLTKYSYKNRKTSVQRKKINLVPVFKKLFLYSLPIFVSEFLRFFSLGLDRIFLAGFFDTARAGIYDVGIALCLGYLIIANSYGNALLPAASVYQKDLKKSKEKLIKTMKPMAILYILYTLLLLVVGKPLINFINPQYMLVFEFLSPLILVYMVIGIFTLLCFFVNAIGYQRYAVCACGVFAFLSFILNLYLIPKLMYFGAIDAILIASLTSSVLLTGLIWRKMK